jgi:hypothetical protein
VSASATKQGQVYKNYVLSKKVMLFYLFAADGAKLGVRVVDWAHSRLAP